MKQAKTTHREEELIPIACHIDPETLITKNGELIQTLYITPLIKTRNICTNLREKVKYHIRQGIEKYVNDINFAIYLHVIRDKEDITQQSDAPNSYLKNIDELWVQENRWDAQFVNTLYISLVYKMPRSTLSDITANLKALLFPFYIKEKHSAMERYTQYLNRITGSILDELKDFSIRKLSVREINGLQISEPLSLMSKIIHLEDRSEELQYTPADLQIGQLDIRYNFNSLEIHDEQGVREAAVFSVKEMHDLPALALDELLQSEQYLMITEVLLLDHKDNVTKVYQEYESISQASKDLELIESNGIKSLLKERANTFIKNQVSVVVYTPEPSLFQSDVERFVSACNELGIVVVREDFFMAKVFWSQVPGNIKYMTRLFNNVASQSAAFTSIHSELLLRYAAALWAEPVAIFKTLRDNPFYFNLHSHSNNSFNLLLGPSEAGKSTLAKFIMAQSAKQHAKVIYISLKEKDHFILKLGGEHIIPRLDILDFKNFGEDLEFTQAFFALLLGEEKEGTYADSIKQLVRAMSQDNGDQVKKTEVLGDGIVKRKVKALLESDDYNALFSQQDEIQEDIRFISIPLDQYNRVNAQCYAMLLLFNLLKSTDDKTLIVIEDLDQVFYSKALCNMLDIIMDSKLSDKVACLISSRYPEVYKQIEFGERIDKFGTQILMADRYASKGMKKLFKLTESELQQIKSYDKNKRMFLVKQNENSVAAGFKSQTLNKHLNGRVE